MADAVVFLGVQSCCLSLSPNVRHMSVYSPDAPIDRTMLFISAFQNHYI